MILNILKLCMLPFRSDYIYVVCGGFMITGALFRIVWHLVDSKS